MNERIPILRIGRFLLVSIQVDLDDEVALGLQDDLTSAISRHRASGVLIDISSLEVVDSFIGRVLGQIASVSRILDARTVLVGMRPAVAITLVEMGVRMSGVETALNVDRGLALLGVDRLAMLDAPRAAAGLRGARGADGRSGH